MASTPTSSLSTHILNSITTIPNPNPNQQRRRLAICSSPTQDGRSSPTAAADGRRRFISVGLLLLHSSFAIPNCADAASPFDKYVKRKKLDPLEAYVPAVLLSEAQFKDLDKSLDVEQPRYDVSRSLLRSGPVASLRVNIRAVAQYATDDGNGKVASEAVDQCLRALEDLDSLLLNATRNDPRASVGSMKSKLTIALSALDRLLQTVPTSVLNKGKAIADAYMNPSIEEESQPDLDPDLRQLEAIL